MHDLGGLFTTTDAEDDDDDDDDDDEDEAAGWSGTHNKEDGEEAGGLTWQARHTNANMFAGTPRLIREHTILHNARANAWHTVCIQRARRVHEHR